MSNAKWLRLAEALIKHAAIVLKIEFKKVQGNHMGVLYIHADMTFEFDYWPIGFEGCNSLGGWLLFKEIEYIIFPRVIDAKSDTVQDLAAIEKIINHVGQFAIDRDENRLKLFCYQE